MSSEYKILEEIYRGRKRVVYRAEREQDGTPVIIKTLTADFISERDIEGLRQEYEILHNLHIAGIPKAYGLERLHNRPALILEDIGGEPLETLIGSKKIDPFDKLRAGFTTFLKIGIKLSGTIAELHQNNVIHKDIAPKNIVVNLKTDQVRFIDFSISSRLPQESQKISHPNLLQGTLAYMSPEQTGRMNRVIDYRTDFYSLGITFYEMLTGKLPFYSDDPMELVHFHIAKTPTPPHELNPDIPLAVSGIVMKLLAKNAEDRYKSAHGLKYDLEKCLAEWQTDGKVIDFAPGERDFSDRFQISQKLYGREEEIETLMTAFGRVGDGATEMMLVSGYSGIGKTSLINEVHKPIAKQKGYFISGKFDQFKRSIPYSAMIQAFQELVRQLLTEGEKEVETWKDRLTYALGPNGQVIADVIPEVELIIGEQPPVPELPPVESQNRFNLVFQRFIGVFTQKDHSLVIFLDDLQWADSATLKLLQALMTEPDIRYLLLIGAYRDNEVGVLHPLMMTLGEIEKAGAKLSRIVLNPLNIVQLNEFIADTLLCETERSMPLAELVLSKTDGNPFFVTQFLKSLYDEKLLRLDRRNGGWQFNLERIKGMGMTDNVIELMARKIQKLSEETQRVLKLASCIGNQFDLNTLSIVNERSPEEVAGDLWEAVQEGLVIGDFEYPPSQPLRQGSGQASPAEGGRGSFANSQFRFLHDRVQQAAYSLIPDEDKKAVHLKVGRLILQHSDGAEREEKLFDIVNHLNIGCELIAEENERTELARLNLAAGRKAKSSTAYEAALGYLNSGIALLKTQALNSEPRDSWESDYDLTFALHIEAAECKYLCGHFEDADRDFDLLLERAHTRLDKAQIYSLRCIQYENMARFADAVRCGREGLALFGVSFPDSPGEQQTALGAEISTIQTLMGDRTIDSLIDLPVMDDPEVQAVMKLLGAVCIPAYLSEETILCFLSTATMVRLSLVHGNTEESAFGYALYAITIGSVLGDYKAGYDFGKLAFRVNEHLDDPWQRARIHQVFHATINLWRMPIETCFPHSREACRIGLETGNFTYAGYAVFTESWYALLISRELGQFVRDYSPNIAFLKKVKIPDLTEDQKVILNWALALQGIIADRLSLADGGYNEDAFLGDHIGKSHFLMYLNVAKVHLCLTFEEYGMALEAARKVRGTARYLQGTIWPVLLDFLTGLALAASYRDADDEGRRSYLVELEVTSGRLGVLAENCPENFLCWSLMLQAEIARIRGRDIKAVPLYDRAIRYARERENLMNGALANELYARFWREQGDKDMAGLYLREAYERYSEWGATARVKDLEEKYRLSLFSAPVGEVHEPPPRSDFRTPSSTSGIGSEALDLITVIKASQAISGEIVLDQLVEKLMKIAIENAGAQKGVLILEKDGKMVIEARGSAERDEVAVLHSIPVGASYAPPLPQTILNYVRRTHESVVLSHAGDDSQFGGDPYVSAIRPKSILSTPILNQGKLTGILYLENNLTTNAFTPNRIEVMQILCSQAAVSLENARLYEESKQAANELRFLNDLVEQTVQPVAVVDFDGHLVRFNRAYEQLTGYSRDELHNMSYQKLTPKSWHEIEAGHISRLIEEDSPVRYEKEYRRKDGTLVPLEIVADIYRNAYGEPIYLYAFVTDITERKRAEEALRESNQFNKDIISTAGEGIIVYDDELRYVVWNQFMEKLSGMSAEQVIGKYANNLFPHLREKGVYSLLQRALSGETVFSPDVPYYVSQTGKSGWVSGTYVPHRTTNGDIIGVIGLVRDVTDRKRAEEELQQRVSFSKLISSLSTHFINLASDEIDDGINYALKTIGEFADVDRSYIFLYRGDGKVIDNTHEWCAPRIEPQINRLKGLPVDTFPWIMGKHKRGELVHIPRVSDLPPEAGAEREEFESEGIRSLIAISLVFGKSPIGFVGFDSVREEKTWDEETIELLKIMGEMFTNALAHKRSQEALKESFAELSKKNREIEELKNRLQVENIYLREEIKTEYNFEEIVGQSEPLVKLLRSVEQVARTDATALIFGETGTGKELIARAVHNLSRRKDSPLVKVNCGAISAGLVESELFGHEKGAFTGALQRRVGRFELADGGTIFLDEVSELPLDIQTKLLRVLQEGEFERVGSSNTIKVNVRVIAATNRDLEESVKAGSFRSDLFYRLNVFPLEVPPLRERKPDIPHLVNFFVTKFGKRLGKEFHSVSKETMNQLMNYFWPGNIRELQNVIERAVVLSQGPEIRIDVREPLPRQIHQGQGSTETHVSSLIEVPVVSPVEQPVVSTVGTPALSATEASDGDPSLGLGVHSQSPGRETLEDMERAHILRVLERTNWVVEGKRGAAGVLGMNPSTLRSRMRKLGIKKL